MREYYRTNEGFRYFVDNVKPEDFHEVIDFIVESMRRHTGEHVDLNFLKDLIDVDFCVMIQNVIQAPVILTIPEDYIRQLYSTHGFSNVRRLRRYVKRQNIRKFVAPLHYEINHPMSQLLYGSGNLEFIGEKSVGEGRPQ